jgi:hypothetical protein
MTTDRSRRRFVGTVAAAAAWTSLGRVNSAESAIPGDERSAVPLASGKPERLKLGLASYSMREFPLDQALAWAKLMDVKYMTFKDVHVPRTDTPEATRALRAKIEAAGITIMGGGTITIKNDAAQIKKEFEYAKNAGFPLIYVDPDPAALDTLEQMAKTYDIKVAIHNHGPENKNWPAPRDAYAAVKSRDKRLGLCIDIGHTLAHGHRPGPGVPRVPRSPVRHARQGSVVEDRAGEPGRSRQGRDRLPGAVQDVDRDRLSGSGRPRVRDQRQGAAAGDDRVDGVHARRPRGRRDPDKPLTRHVGDEAVRPEDRHEGTKARNSQRFRDFACSWPSG